MAREICVKKLSKEGNFFSVRARLLEGKVGQFGRMGQREAISKRWGEVMGDSNWSTWDEHCRALPTSEWTPGGVQSLGKCRLSLAEVARLGNIC